MKWKIFTSNSCENYNQYLPEIHSLLDTQEYAHHLKLVSLEDLDEQLHNWLCEAYALGMR